MKALVFDIKGRFAHFKAMETTRANISFPFPPRTAILGLIGAIMGIPRNLYWQDTHPLASARIALEILAPVQRTGIKVNYLQTRNPIVLRSKDSVTVLIPKDPFEVKARDQRGFNSPVRLDLLKRVHYRVYFNIDDVNFYQKFRTRLEDHKYCFPPYLGHANLLAEIKFINETDLKALLEGIYQPHSLVTVSHINELKISIDEVGFTMVYNVPMKMKFTKKVINTNRIKADSILLTKVATVFLNKAYEKNRLKASFKANEVYEGSLCSGQTRQVCFFPS